MAKEDIDKLQRSIEDFVEIYPDVVKAKESDDKITLAEGGVLFVKHGMKIFRFATAIPEMAKEIIDIDSEEGGVLASQIVEAFGGGDESKEALIEISEGAGKINQGIQKLVALKKA